MSVSGDGASNPVVFRRDAVRVLVPATSANLGPAFDSAGLALELVDELVAMVTDDAGVLVEVSGEGSDDLPRDSSHLVVRAMALGFSALGAAPEGFVLKCTNVIPHGRGLGSSAAAIIGGLMLARALVVEGSHQLSDDDLLQLARTMESHPDNISAALLGSFTIAWISDDGIVDAARIAVNPELRAVVAIPSFEVPTRSARAALPAQVDFSTAGFNIARSALLVHAMTQDPSLLFEATADRMHQEQRREMYAPSMALVDSLRARGIAAAISGAGPTVISLVTVDGVDFVLGLIEGQWRSFAVPIRIAGAQVTDS
jgi:homoserine kinase